MINYTANIGGYDELSANSEGLVFTEKISGLSDTMSNRWYKFNPPKNQRPMLYHDANIAVTKGLIDVLNTQEKPSIILIEHPRGKNWTVYEELLLNCYRRKVTVFSALFFLFECKELLHRKTSHNSVILYRTDVNMDGFWGKFANARIKRDQLYLRQWLEDTGLNFHLVPYEVFKANVKVWPHVGYKRTFLDEFMGLLGILIISLCRLFVFHDTQKM